MLTKQRIQPIITQKIKITSLELLRPRERESIDFDVKLSNGKPLQRGYVWNANQKSQLVLSFLKGLDIGTPLVVYEKAEDGDAKYRIVDGKQRVSTLLSFMDGEFPVVVDGEDYYFNDLELVLKWRFQDSILCRVIYIYWDTPLSDLEYIQLFEYANFLGTPQDENHLQTLMKSVK